MWKQSGGGEGLIAVAQINLRHLNARGREEGFDRFGIKSDSLQVAQGQPGDAHLAHVALCPLAYGVRVRDRAGEDVFELVKNPRDWARNCDFFQCIRAHKGGDRRWTSGTPDFLQAFPPNGLFE